MNKKIPIFLSIVIVVSLLIFVVSLLIFIGKIYYDNTATFTFGGGQSIASGASFSFDGKKIVFGAINTVGEQIFIMGSDGSNIKRLTNKGNNKQPSFSPDGSKIVFTKDSEIYIMDSNGSNKKRITHNGSGQYKHDPSFSPDGSRIIFAKGNGFDNYGIFIINTDGTNERNIYSKEDYIESPRFFPDGDNIIFSGIDKKINIINISNGSSKISIIENIEGRNPTLSFDGKKILFSEFRGELFTFDLDTKKVKQVTKNGGQNFYPSFSPDERKVIFISLLNNGYYLCQVNADGSNPQHLNIKDSRIKN